MFSVIVPVYNGEKYIENAVECVLAQTFTEWEIVIVNDGSTDNTLKILEKYSDNEKIRVISRENGGVSAARNIAMKNARFDYFAFLDCDDYWYPHHLETMKSMIDRHPDAGVFTTLMKTRTVDGGFITNKDFFNKKGCKENDMIYLKNALAEYDEDKTIKGNMSGSCYSRKAAEKVGGFREGCKIGEDLAFYLTSVAYYPLVMSSIPTAIYERQNSIATADVSFDTEWFFFDEVGKILNDNALPYETKKHLKSLMQWFVMRRARHYAVDGKRDKAWKCYKEIGKNKSLFKDKLITLALLFMPAFLVKRIFLIRWRTQG